jgi:hypothetical protein
MKLTILGIIVFAVTAFALQTGPAQTPAETIKVRGCLLGNGSTENPWSLRAVVLPAPPSAAPAGPGGGRGDGGGRGAGGGRGRGDAAGQGGAPADGDRGGNGGRGAAPPAPTPASAPPQPPVDLRLTDIDMSPWRNMFVEVEGTLGPRPASGLREFQVSFAHSAYGDCR